MVMFIGLSCSAQLMVREGRVVIEDKKIKRYDREYNPILGVNLCLPWSHLMKELGSD